MSWEGIGEPYVNLYAQSNQMGKILSVKRFNLYLRVTEVHLKLITKLLKSPTPWVGAGIALSQLIYRNKCVDLGRSYRCMA